MRAFFDAMKAKGRLLLCVLASLRPSHSVGIRGSDFGSWVRRIPLGGSHVELVIRGNRDAKVILINLHQNERTSIMAARSVMIDSVHRLIELRAQGHRNVVFWIGIRPYAFDPNRIFSDQGIYRTLFFHGSYSDVAHSAIKVLRDAIIEELQVNRASMVIALHNNGASHFTVNSYLPGAEHAAQAHAVHVQLPGDPGDFFLVTHKHAYKVLCTSGFNVVLQNPAAPGDGSLSQYFNQMPTLYVNVEARFGHDREQREMLDFVLMHHDRPSNKAKRNNDASVLP